MQTKVQVLKKLQLLKKNNKIQKKKIDPKPKRKENMYIGYPIVIQDLVSKGKRKNVSKKNKKKNKKSEDIET